MKRNVKNPIGVKETSLERIFKLGDTLEVKQSTYHIYVWGSQGPGTPETKVPNSRITTLPTLP